jgi:hypothetical protein
MPSRAGCHSGSPQSGESGGTISPLFFFFFFLIFLIGEPEVAWAALGPMDGGREQPGALVEFAYKRGRPAGVGEARFGLAVGGRCVGEAVRHVRLRVVLGTRPGHAHDRRWLE